MYGVNVTYIYLSKLIGSKIFMLMTLCKTHLNFGFYVLLLFVNVFCYTLEEFTEYALLTRKLILCIISTSASSGCL